MPDAMGGMKPGCTEFTRMLSFPWRTAMALEKILTAPFDALYAGCPPAEPTSPMMEEMLMMDPPPASSILGTAALVPRKTPLELTSMILSQPSMAVSSVKARLLIPALLTSTSNLPKLETARSTALAQSASCVTSNLTNNACPPASAIWASTALPSSSEISPMTTLAPSRAKMRASSAPIPRAPPEIRATFPSNRILLLHLWSFNLSLPGGEPAIHHKFGAGDVGRLVRGQEQHGVGDLYGPSLPSHRDCRHSGLLASAVAPGARG